MGGVCSPSGSFPRSGIAGPCDAAFSSSFVGVLEFPPIWDKRTIIEGLSDDGRKAMQVRMRRSVKDNAR